MKLRVPSLDTPFGNALLTLGVLALCSLALPDLPIWITDNGNKYIVMRNHAQHGTTELRHSEPEFFPDGNFHFVRYRGSVRSFYPEYYPLVVSPVWRRFGDRAAMWMSMLGTAVAVWLAGILLGNRMRGAPLLLAFATPMFFFSFLLWEMTWSVCFSLAALVLLQRKQELAAGIILGAGLLLREEMYCVLIALTVGEFLGKNRAAAGRLVAGFVLAAIPIWFRQYAEFGHILGFHGGNYYANNRPAGGTSLSRELLGTLWNYRHHLFRFDAFKEARLDLPCQLPIFAACVLGAFTSHRLETLKRIVGGAALCGWTALVVAFWLAPRHDVAFSAAFVTGALGSDPLFLPFMLNWRKLLKDRSRPVRAFAWSAAVYLLLVPPLLTRFDIGLIYGARHFLCVMPILLFLSVRAIRLGLAPGRIIWIPAILTAMVLQAGSFTMLKCVSEESAAFEAKIEAAPEHLVVTDAFFLPEQTPHLFFSKTVCKLTDEKAEKLVRRLRERGEREFLLVLSNRYRNISDAGLARLLAAAPPVAPPERFHPDAGSGFMDLYIVRCRLK